MSHRRRAIAPANEAGTGRLHVLREIAQQTINYTGARAPIGSSPVLGVHTSLTGVT